MSSLNDVLMTEKGKKSFSASKSRDDGHNKKKSATYRNSDMKIFSPPTPFPPLYT